MLETLTLDLYLTERRTKMKNKAKSFASQAHSGQVRKHGNVPYITHPIRVAALLESAGCRDELVCAGYLHDVVEDTTCELEDIENAFGSVVSALVAAHTEDKSKSWQERKQHTIDLVRTANEEVKQLIVADKLDNLLDIEKQYNEIGEKVWHLFNAPKEKQQWYYEAIAANMYMGYSNQKAPAFFHEYEKAIQRVFHPKND